ncbi:MAG: ferrous iron transport protein B [Phycisphaerales bacterium]|nr:ferrous iron transport protein B [Phycisphaerales bacterium]
MGNPNTGKSALFNALTGFRRHVANYPGVTVDVGRGPVRGTQTPIELLDLPGAYSLAAVSPDEQILCDALHGRMGAGPPAAILVVVDATNLMRNLYLVSQVLELGLPVVVALNMMDIAQRRGLRIDTALLSKRLGVPVVPVTATRDETVAPLVVALDAVLHQVPPRNRPSLPEPLSAQAVWLSEHGGIELGPAEALRVLVDGDGHAERAFLARHGQAAALTAARHRLAALNVLPGPAEVRARYAWVAQVLDGVIERMLPNARTWTNHLDAVLTHRFGGALILLALLYGLFHAIYTFADIPMEAIERFFGAVGVLVGSWLPEGFLQSLVVDGLIAGVGGVLVFLPQILILFLFIAMLEDCGYLSRAAFMVDRLMRPLGLSGRAFIPLLSSFACAIPAIMGTRAIGDRRERFITVLLAPFMSCSARLPVYVLLTSALVPKEMVAGGWLRLDALVLLGMYLVGVVVAVPLALVLRKLVFRGPAHGFLMELPSYKWPRLRTLWQRVYTAGRGFVLRAGSIILLVNLLVWTLGYFPRHTQTEAAVRGVAVAEGWDEDETDAALSGAFLRESYLGRMGRAIEPALAPLGWDWRIGVGVIASFPAREVIIATLGTVFNLGAEQDEEAVALRELLARVTWEDSDRPLFTLPVALSIMVFFALCAQCGATLVTMGRELRSFAWPVISFIGMTTIAYCAAWATAAGATALGW